MTATTAIDRGLDAELASIWPLTWQPRHSRWPSDSPRVPQCGPSLRHGNRMRYI